MSATSTGHHGGLFLCEACSFDDVLGAWSRELWPGRISKIESNSAMKWLGGTDMSLMQESPSFWRVVRAPRNREDTVRQTVGVLSGHFGGLIDGTRAYRTRGLWVAESVRRHGVGQMLMGAAFEQAGKERCSAIWTFPRQSSMAFYETMGFNRVGAWIGVDDPGAGEFGPNCYALSERR